MEELLELKNAILNRDYDEALAFVDELAEMSKKDIINNIRNYAVILLLHLIKQIVEERSTKSWDASIAVSVLEINALNRRRKSKGTYLDAEELKEALESAYTQAVIKASVEALEGRLSAEQIEDIAPLESVVAIALNKLKHG